MGCLTEVPRSSIVRLTHENGVASARALSPDDVADLISDPFLRSSSALDALFHRGAVVVEADSDRAFYDEINRRLQSVGRGMNDVLLISAHSNSEVRRFVEPLRSIGVPVAALVDLDTLKTGQAFKQLMDACQIPAATRSKIGTRRKIVETAFASLTPSTGASALIKTKGISALGVSDRAIAEKLLLELAEYGLFLVPSGELESWLRPLSVSGHGPKWLTKMFSALGSVPGTAPYVPPAADDVWKFLDQVATWIDNPKRLGVA